MSIRLHRFPLHQALPGAIRTKLSFRTGASWERGLPGGRCSGTALGRKLSFVRSQDGVSARPRRRWCGTGAARCGVPRHTVSQRALRVPGFRNASGRHDGPPFRAMCPGGASLPLRRRLVGPMEEKGAGGSSARELFTRRRGLKRPATDPTFQIARQDAGIGGPTAERPWSCSTRFLGRLHDQELRPDGHREDESLGAEHGVPECNRRWRHASGRRDCLRSHSRRLGRT